MKPRALVILVVACLAVTSPLVAEICTVDDVPAATLLLPYFEAGGPTGLNTIFEINNASASAVVAHVVVWSDLSVPVLDFNVYLTGYDVVPINMYLVVGGILPRTAPQPQDPDDDISPQGPLSEDVGFPQCENQLPLDPLPPSFVDHLHSSLTGQPSALFNGDCFGRDLGDGIPRGYVTVDVVDRCSLQFPGEPGYFVNGGGGIAQNGNVLWGNYYYVTLGGAIASAGPLVHVEADGTNPETAIPGEYTFYGRYLTPKWSAADNREPLATNFAARYLTAPASGFTGTSLIAWRDSHVSQDSFECTATLDDPGPVPPNTQLASWFPLGQEEIVIFDEEENVQVPERVPVSPVPPRAPGLAPFPAESQRVQIGGPEFPVPFANGWLFLNLNHDVDGPPEDPAAAQAYVGVEIQNGGLFNVGYDAIALDSACNASHVAVDTTGNGGG